MISAFSTDMGVLPQLAVRRAGIARPLDGLPEVGMNCGDSIRARDTPRSASATTPFIRPQLARTLHKSLLPHLPLLTLHPVMPRGPSSASSISIRVIPCHSSPPRSPPLNSTTRRVGQEGVS